MTLLRTALIGDINLSYQARVPKREALVRQPRYSLGRECQRGVVRWSAVTQYQLSSPFGSTPTDAG